MGADMIGYQTMMPEQLTDDEKKKLNKHLDDVEKLLKTPNLPKLITEEEDAKGTYLAQLNELVPMLTNEIEEQGFHDDEEELKYLVETYADFIPDARGFIDSIFIDGRDVSTRYYNILGRKFVSFFAGELSWGDEPEGGGYEQLKNLDKLNLLWKIEQMTIPISKSLHFIKEDE